MVNDPHRHQLTSGNMAKRPTPHLPEPDLTEALTAPLRLLVGFFVGGALSVLAFGLAWSSYWPNGFDAFSSFVVQVLVIGMVGAGLGAGLYAVRPTR